MHIDGSEARNWSEGFRQGQLAAQALRARGFLYTTLDVRIQSIHFENLPTAVAALRRVRDILGSSATVGVRCGATGREVSLDAGSADPSRGVVQVLQDQGDLFDTGGVQAGDAG